MMASPVQVITVVASVALLALLAPDHRQMVVQRLRIAINGTA